MSALLGRCEDLSCNHLFDVRLFECSFHCERRLCFQHLAEHNIQYEQERHNRLDAVQTELNSALAIYTAVVDETKLRHEFEQKLMKHRQLVQRAKTVLNESDTSLERIHAVIEELREAMNRNQHLSSPVVIHETVVKMEPDTIEVDEAVPTEDFNLTLVNDPVSQLESKNDHEDIKCDKSELALMCIEQDNDDHPERKSDDDTDSVILADRIRTEKKIKEKKTRASRNRFYLSRAPCPLTFDGAFGLTKVTHALRTCSPNPAKDIFLHDHFHNFHFLTRKASLLLIAKVMRGCDPKIERPFVGRHIDSIVDAWNKLTCPFSKGTKNVFACQPKHIHNAPCQLIGNLSQMKKHLRNVHRLTDQASRKIIDIVKEQGGRCLSSKGFFEPSDNIADMDLMSTKNSLPRGKRQNREKSQQ